MINTLKIAAILKKVCDDPTKPDFAFLKLKIVPGEIFQIDGPMLKQLCDELKQGVGLTECGRTDILPYGISQDAEIENNCLSITIKVRKGRKFGGRHSYGSTDDLIIMMEDRIVGNFFVGLGNVVCECDTCHKNLSMWSEERCDHWPGEKNKNDKVNTYTIKEGRALIVSSVALQVTDNDNIELLSLDGELDKINMRLSRKEFLSRDPRIMTRSSHHRFDN